MYNRARKLDAQAAAAAAYKEPASETPPAGTRLSVVDAQNPVRLALGTWVTYPWLNSRGFSTAQIAAYNEVPLVNYPGRSALFYVLSNGKTLRGGG